LSRSSFGESDTNISANAAVAGPKQKIAAAAIRQRNGSWIQFGIIPNAATFFVAEDGNIPTDRTSVDVGILPNAATDSTPVEGALSASEQLSGYRSHQPSCLAQAASLL
jgi:hypothetical protein